MTAQPQLSRDLALRLATPALPCPAHDPQPAPAARLMSQAEDQVLLQTLRGATVAMVRSDAADLSARQLGVFLTVYLTEGPHTVRGMAAELNVSKPAITRALDRLGELDLVHRKVDPLDRRSVLAQRTSKGGKFLAQLRRALLPPPAEEP